MSISVHKPHTQMVTRDLSACKAKTSTRVPLPEQIAELLHRQIQSGELVDGERLPPERQMAAQLGISVGTLRKALTELEYKGLLTRVQGSGNYIRFPVDPDNIYALFRLELKDGPARPGARLLSLQKLAKPASLRFMSDTPHAFRFRRIRTLNGVSAALEEIWLDGKYTQSISKALVPESLYQFYQQQLNCRITRVKDCVSVAGLPPWRPVELVAGAENTEHWGYIERLSMDQDAEPAEFSRTWFDPAKVRFVSR